MVASAAGGGSSLTPEATPTATASAASPNPSPSATIDKRYDTCAEANDDGNGPYYEDVDPEYNWYDDSDGDGIVCEPADSDVPDVDVPDGDDREGRFCRRKWWC